jgi:steroid 5-alpha reductase family enzyme
MGVFVMQKKYTSLLLILVIYLMAFVIGIFAFFFFDTYALIVRLLFADLSMTFFIWLASLILRNASLYDPYWSVIPPLLLIGGAIYLDVFNSLSVIWLIIALSIWGIRLTYNWASLWDGFHHVDWRYEKIRRVSPKLYPLSNLLAIQLFPTIIVFVQLIGAISFMENPESLNLWVLFGGIIIILAAALQLISDEQMKRFKRAHQGEKLCIEEGLWKYSRHPNYFGEVMVWWGLYLFYFGTFKTIDLVILAPIAMTGLFLLISIPWMEKKILETRPEYKGYQSRVSMLIPFFRKEVSEQANEKNA